VVLSAGILLVVALIVFLAVGRWKHRLGTSEILKALGPNIQQEANGYTYSHALGAHAQYKIHASKEVQFKQGNARLHDVKIELYGEDGSRVDRIEGAEFDYDQKAGSITAIGPVEITLMRPGAALAVAPKAMANQAKNSQAKNATAKATPLSNAAKTAASGEIHVRTSGLSFDQKSGIATTKEHVDFSMTQGTGSSMGATYDSQEGQLVLDHAVELNSPRTGGTVVLHAQHAEFERDTDLCTCRPPRPTIGAGKRQRSRPRYSFAETARRSGWTRRTGLRSPPRMAGMWPRPPGQWISTSTTNRTTDILRAAWRWTPCGRMKAKRAAGTCMQPRPRRSLNSRPKANSATFTWSAASRCTATS